MHELTSRILRSDDSLDRLYPIAIFGFFARSCLTILEVGSHTDLCLDMHIWRTDLDLCRLRAKVWKKPDYRGMERLISIFFWEGDIILEPLWHRDEHIVEDSEDLIAVSHIIRDDTDSEEIIEITRMRIGVVLARELPIDRKRGLDPIRDIEDRDRVRDDTTDHFSSLVDEKILLLTQGDELCRDTSIILWMEDTETLRFESFSKLKYTESISDRSIDIEGFEGNPFPLCWIRMMIECLHIVQSISELDHDDTKVTDHRHEHLAEGLDRPFFSSIADCGQLR
jgi:hypothetical protein